MRPLPSGLMLSSTNEYNPRLAARSPVFARPSALILLQVDGCAALFASPASLLERAPALPCPEARASGSASRPGSSVHLSPLRLREAPARPARLPPVAQSRACLLQAALSAIVWIARTGSFCARETIAADGPGPALARERMVGRVSLHFFMKKSGKSCPNGGRSLAPMSRRRAGQ